LGYSDDGPPLNGEDFQPPQATTGQLKLF
jgi:hypothetical protein